LSGGGSKGVVSERIGRAMIQAAQSGAPSAIFESIDINKMAVAAMEIFSFM